MNYNYNTFKVHLTEELMNSLGNTYTLELERIFKPGRGLLDALVIKDDVNNIFPTLYFKDLFEYYKEGASLKEITSAVLLMVDRYIESVPDSFVLSRIEDFNNIKSRICLRLISTPGSAKITDNAPSRKWLDLTVIYVIVLCGSDCVCTTQITNQMLALWNITTEELDIIARQNLEVLLPLNCKEYPNGSLKDGPFPVRSIIHISDKWNALGTSHMLNEHFLKSLSDAFEDDFLIFPIDMHSFVVIPMCMCASKECMDKLTISFQILVSLPDQLTNHTYLYSRKTGTVSI